MQQLTSQEATFPRKSVESIILAVVSIHIQRPQQVSNSSQLAGDRQSFQTGTPIKP